MPPRRHQRLRLTTARIEEVQHAARPATAGAALGIAADRPLLVEKTDGLLQHGFREPQLGVNITEIVHQGGGVAVAIEQALQNPAHSQLQPQMLNRRLLKECADGLQARDLLAGSGSHHHNTSCAPLC